MNGIIHDLPEQAYHSRPELSSTGARLILDSPARFRWAQDHPQQHRAAFDLGTAVHTRVLGTGARAIAYPDDVLAANGAASTKAAKDWADSVRVEGMVPMKAADLKPIEDMAEAVLAHADARAILETLPGREVSIFADVNGVPTRARFDIWGERDAADLKTAVDASPNGFNRAVDTYGLHVQEAWYRGAHRAVTGAELESFKFLVVEKTAPYLTAVYDLDIVWRDIGKEQAEKARGLWLRCTDTGEWPGYTSGTLSCPTHVVFRHDDTFEEIEI